MISKLDTIFATIIADATSKVRIDSGKIVVEPSRAACDVARLEKSLTLVADDDQWNWQHWLDYADRAACPIFVAGREIDAPEGFAAINPILELSYDGREISLGLDVLSIYVAPFSRGMKIGSALRRAVAEFARLAVEAVAELPDDVLEELGVERFSVAVDAMPQSHGGKYFVEALHDEVSLHLKSLRSSAWFGDATVRYEADDVDDEDDAGHLTP